MEKGIFELAKTYELWSVVGVFLICYVIKDKKDTISRQDESHKKVVQDLKEDKERLYKIVDEHGEVLEKLHQTNLKVAEMTESISKRMEKVDLELAVLKAQYTRYTGNTYSVNNEEMKG